MQRLGDELFPASGLTRDQRDPRVWRIAANEREELLHRRVAADHSAQRALACQLSLGMHELIAAPNLVTHVRQQPPHPADVKRLGQVVRRAGLDRFNRRHDAAFPGHQDDVAPGITVTHGAHDVETSDIGHPQVDEDEIHPASGEPLDRLTSAGARVDLVPHLFGQSGDQSEDRLVVVDDKQSRTCLVWGLGHDYTTDLESGVGPPPPPVGALKASATFCSSWLLVNGLRRKGASTSFSPPRTATDRSA